MHVYLCAYIYIYIYTYIYCKHTGVFEINTHLDGAGVVNVPKRACAPRCQRALHSSKPFWHTQYPYTRYPSQTCISTQFYFNVEIKIR